MDVLLIQSAEKELYESRTWNLLLKYKKRPFGGYLSQADGMEFFNSPAGKTNPRLELAETLRSFFTLPVDIPSTESHPQCKFPARFKWLNRQLSFDPERLPFQNCGLLKQWLKDLDPKGATLVFASQFMSNPVSMFGHTLLRIDSGKTGPHNELLDYGVNYAAKTDTKNAALYAMKGLGGLFKGHFSVFPYYAKVQEYSDFEGRGLWQYEINLSEDQLEYLLLHLWELGGAHFDYFYLQENCSYHILSLLEVANPTLHLTDRFLFSVIPADAIKSLTAYEGLVKKVSYRPSVFNQLNHKRGLMDARERQIFSEVVKNPSLVHQAEFRNRSVSSQALILDSYLDYLQYKGAKSRNEKTRTNSIRRSVLSARSELNYKIKDGRVIEIFSSSGWGFAARPDLGHGTDRVRFGLGRNDDEPFQEFAYRPALHDLLAKDAGYDRDSEILVFDFKFRYFNETERFKVDKAKLLGITKLNPHDPLYIQPSWRLDLGVDVLRDIDCQYCNSFRGDFGMGYSYRPQFFSSFLIFGFLDVESEFSGRLDESYRLGAKAEIGAFVELTENWKIQITGGYKNFFFGDEKDFFTASLNQRASISQNIDLRFEFHRHDQNNEGVFGVNFYF